MNPSPRHDLLHSSSRLNSTLRPPLPSPQIRTNERTGDSLLNYACADIHSPFPVERSPRRLSAAPPPPSSQHSKRRISKRDCLQVGVGLTGACSFFSPTTLSLEREMLRSLMSGCPCYFSCPVGARVPSAPFPKERGFLYCPEFGVFSPHPR